MGRRIPDVLTDDELAALLAVPNVTTPTGLRNRCVMELCANAGLRSKEVVGLRTADIRHDGGEMVLHLSVTKGSVVRRVPCPPQTANWVQLWMARRTELGIRTRALFCTISRGQRRARFAKSPELRPGRALNPRYVREIVARYARRAGIERRVTVHMLRHTYATRLLRHSGNIRLVQTALGHRSITTTQIYTHVLNDELSDAVRTLPVPGRRDE